MLNGVVVFFRRWNRRRAMASARSRSAFLAALASHDLEVLIFGDIL